MGRAKPYYPEGFLNLCRNKNWQAFQDADILPAAYRRH